MLVHEHLIFMKDKKLQGKLHAVSNVSVFISSLEKCFYCTIDVSGTASHEIALVHLPLCPSATGSVLPSIHPSVRH